MGNQPRWLLLMMAMFLPLLSSRAVAARTDDSFKKFGLEKKAWPEFTGKDAKQAFDEITKSGIVKNVYIQKPDPKDGQNLHGGNVDDVWIYTDGEGLVVGIPQRGDWHPNRINPGWVDLKGVNYEEAMKTILDEETGVQVHFGPQGFIRTDDFVLTRVFLEVDKDGKVAEIPRLG
ncbi:hypothetical protein Mapa_003414 [Marchantia paleacea]|nr:hypothetical protein Mapa_003414 [Marchantia paleacea]